MDTKAFEVDMKLLSSKFAQTGKAGRKLEVVMDELVRLRQKNLVKINHSALEFLCAEKLIQMGYDVAVEHRLTATLVCDVFAEQTATGTTIVEIETGFVPPNYALAPATYCRARVASKIARYAPHAKRFGLGTTPSNVLGIPKIFLEAPANRTDRDVERVKALCDKYYRDPPISLEQIRLAVLSSIYVLDIDNLRVEEITPEKYLRGVNRLPYVLDTP